jgi:dienelactone hydrolase
MPSIHPESPILNTRRAYLRSAIAVLFLAFLAGTAAAQNCFGPQGAPEGEFRQQLWLIPLPHDGDRAMHTAILRPPGEGKKPLAVINHGSPPKPEDRPKTKPGFKTAAEWFVKQGFVVALPIRRGYGDTGGSWAEDYGRCSSPDYRRAGLETAKDIRAAIAYMSKQDFVSPGRTLVVGQSAGGWGTVALASLNPPEVGAMVNFAGGRGGYQKGIPNNNCTPDKLVEAAGEYGKTARMPTLWIYTENDLFFDPGLSRRMADAFLGAGGKADYNLLKPFGKDGHGLFAAAGGVELWRGLVEAFLKANGY